MLCLINRQGYLFQQQIQTKPYLIFCIFKSLLENADMDRMINNTIMNSIRHLISYKCCLIWPNNVKVEDTVIVSILKRIYIYIQFVELKITNYYTHHLIHIVTCKIYSI